MGEILAKYGQTGLKDYVKKFWDVPQALTDNEFLQILKSELADIYNPELSDLVYSQLKEKPLVSTIDHLGIWNHPFFVNSGLIYSLHFKPEEFAVVLATESPSLNNSSWPGSLLSHNSKLKMERYSFFPDRQKTLPVFSTPAIGLQAISQFKQRSAGALNGLLSDLEIAPAENFSAQACQISHRFWQKVFPSAPKQVYLPLETLVSKYLLKIFEDPNHTLSRLIFDHQGQDLWRKFFGDEHTFMFWGIDAKGRRQVLNNLPDSANDLISQIKNRRLYPSSPLCFVVLLLAGFACAGGFTQTTWLTQTKEKFILLLEELDDYLPGIGIVPTKNFAESSLMWFNRGGQYFMPAAVDLYLQGGDIYPKILRLADKMTLGQSFDLALQGVYEVVVPKHQRFQNIEFSRLNKNLLDNLAIKSSKP